MCTFSLGGRREERERREREREMGSGPQTEGTTGLMKHSECADASQKSLACKSRHIVQRARPLLLLLLLLPPPTFFPNPS